MAHEEGMTWPSGPERPTNGLSGADERSNT